MRVRSAAARVFYATIAMSLFLFVAPPVSIAQGSGGSVAVVNGELIPQEEFFDRLQHVRAQDFIVSLNPVQVRPEDAGQMVLNSLIVERLVLQLATKDNVLPSEAEVNEEFEARKKQPEIAQMLNAKLVSEQWLKYDVKVQHARFNLATEKTTITPSEVEAWYKSHIDEFKIPERWKLLGIVTTKPDVLTKIEGDLKANKEFGAVAKTYSEEAGTKDRGGAIGTLSANDPKIPAPMKEAIEKLKPGETSEPIKVESAATANGSKQTLYWIVRLLAREPAVTRSFQEVKGFAEHAALLDKAGGLKVAESKLSAFRKQANITVGLPGYDVFINTPKTP